MHRENNSPQSSSSFRDNRPALRWLLSCAPIVNDLLDVGDMSALRCSADRRSSLLNVRTKLQRTKKTHQNQLQETQNRIIIHTLSLGILSNLQMHEHPDQLKLPKWLKLSEDARARVLASDGDYLQLAVEQTGVAREYQWRIE